MLETPGRMEPCFFEEYIPAGLADLSVEIQRGVSGLGLGLHPDSAAELADLVRLMNCYSSMRLSGSGPVYLSLIPAVSLLSTSCGGDRTLRRKGGIDLCQTSERCQLLDACLHDGSKRSFVVKCFLYSLTTTLFCEFWRLNEITLRFQRDTFYKSKLI